MTFPRTGEREVGSLDTVHNKVNNYLNKGASMGKKTSSSRPETEFFASLGEFLKQLDSPPPMRERKPGRPKKMTAETVPLALHLYRQQVEWLDEYAEVLASYAAENRKLKRVEIIRALLLGLAEHIYKYQLALPEPVIIKNERDLQKAISAALARGR
jgi:hypothetical protein